LVVEVLIVETPTHLVQVISSHSSVL